MEGYVICFDTVSEKRTVNTSLQDLVWLFIVFYNHIIYFDKLNTGISTR